MGGIINIFPKTIRLHWKLPKFRFPKSIINWNIILKWNLCNTSGCVLLSNGNIQYKYLFPKYDGELLNWKTSRLDLSVPLDSQHNKFCCLLSYAVQRITPVTKTHCFRSTIFLQYLPSWEHTNCQFPACRYNINCLSYVWSHHLALLTTLCSTWKLNT